MELRLHVPARRPQGLLLLEPTSTLITAGAANWDVGFLPDDLATTIMGRALLGGANVPRFSLHFSLAIFVRFGLQRGHGACVRVEGGTARLYRLVDPWLPASSTFPTSTSAAATDPRVLLLNSLHRYVYHRGGYSDTLSSLLSLPSISLPIFAGTTSLMIGVPIGCIVSVIIVSFCYGNVTQLWLSSRSYSSRQCVISLLCEICDPYSKRGCY